MGKLNWGKRAHAVALLCAMTAIALRAQTFTTLHSFEFTDGAYPFGGLIQATDGNLYGTTDSGGPSSFCGIDGCGTVFKITPSGSLTTLYSFCPQSGCPDGSNPLSALIQATDGNFYGSTANGGAYGAGTVFRITASGTLTTLYSFCGQGYPCTDGSEPAAALIQATKGRFYGTTRLGGTNNDGTVFRIEPNGTLVQLHSFSGTDGTNPSALIQAADGNFYGTTNTGGASDVGTIFRMTLAGTLTTLYVFNGTDGSSPSALIQTTDGNFYGTTSGGGTNGWGTVFKIMPTGLLTTLYSFDITNGNPSSGLIEATDGNYYGTTRLGGSNNSGTIFQMAPGGSVTTLHSFDYSDGAYPGALVQGTNGGFFGTTFQGGAGNDGTVFLLDVPLSPQAQIAALQSRVKALVSAGTFNGRLGQFLLSPLNEALAALDSGHVPRTIRELVEFIDRVRLLVILRRLTTAEGNTLIDAAESIITPLRG